MQQISTEGVFELKRLGGQGDPLGDVPEIEIRPYEQMVMNNPAPVLENDTHKLLWDFDIHTDHLIRRPDLIMINNNKKENLQNCWLRCPGWPQNKTERMWKEG